MFPIQQNIKKHTGKPEKQASFVDFEKAFR